MADSVDTGWLRDLWYLALPGRQIGRGRMIVRTLLGQRLLFARTNEGEVFCFKDVCPHRGIPLSCGRFDGREVECCYHGWRFGADGRCTAIPSLVEGQDFEPSRIKARTYPVAEVQGNATRFSSLEMAIEGTSLSWSKDGIQIPAERNTQQIFNVLFGVEKDSKETIRRRLSRRGSILDIVADDAKRVNNKLGSEDRSKLDENLTAVRQAEERTRRADEWLNVPKPLVSSAEAASLQRKLSMAQAGEYYRLFYDLMVMALRTDSTRVITCGIGSEAQGGAIPDIGILQQRHGLSHHNDDPEQLRRLTEADTFLISQFSYFLDQLKEHKESETPLLDTTQVLWGSGMAYGQSHGNANLPTILAGGKALGYKHGTHVDFNLPKIGKYNVADATAHYQICSRPVDNDARVSNLLLTMLQSADVKVDKFQDSISPISQIVV